MTLVGKKLKGYIVGFDKFLVCLSLFCRLFSASSLFLSIRPGGHVDELNVAETCVDELLCETLIAGMNVSVGTASVIRSILLVRSAFFTFLLVEDKLDCVKLMELTTVPGNVLPAFVVVTPMCPESGHFDVWVIALSVTVDPTRCALADEVTNSFDSEGITQPFIICFSCESLTKIK